jgi:riboflavin synthase alpha subunit
MFTGIIEKIGEVRSLRRGETGLVEIESGWADLEIGESIAVSGVCLTVEASDGGRFRATLSPETLRRTTLGDLGPGDAVNLERALRLGDRLGGHFVAGHVDCVGRVTALDRRGDAGELVVQFPADLAPYLAVKGSVAVDGVSLTVAELRGDRFTVALIKQTLDTTTLGRRRAGDAVNLEADLLARHALSATRSGDERLLDLLTRQGYV